MTCNSNNNFSNFFDIQNVQSENFHSFNSCLGCFLGGLYHKVYKIKIIYYMIYNGQYTLTFPFLPLVLWPRCSPVLEFAVVALLPAFRLQTDHGGCLEKTSADMKVWLRFSVKTHFLSQHSWWLHCTRQSRAIWDLIWKAASCMLQFLSKTFNLSPTQNL